jgi:hypothetical protein
MGFGQPSGMGALIGFGIGAAAGAAGNHDQHAGARVAAPLLFGAFGALIGAAVGGSHPWMYSRNRHRRHGRDDDHGHEYEHEYDNENEKEIEHLAATATTSVQRSSR